jgi:hypothetical protein
MNLPAAKAELRCEATGPVSQWRVTFPENLLTLARTKIGRKPTIARETRSVADAPKANSLRAATGSPGKTPQPATQERTLGEPLRAGVLAQDLRA